MARLLPAFALLLWLQGPVRLATVAASDAPAEGEAGGFALVRSCFDVDPGSTRPARFVPTGEPDSSRVGKYPDGTDWASTRAVVRLPIREAFAKLRDHRNVKDMRKTRLVVRHLEQTPERERCELDVDVTVRALFFKVHVKWTEEWLYQLAAGTVEQPLLVVASYRKIAGSSYIEHQRGCYQLRALARDATDVALYDEVRATRRSAEDTRAMQLGILENLRGDRWRAEEARHDPRVRHVDGTP